MMMSITKAVGRLSTPGATIIATAVATVWVSYGILLVRDSDQKRYAFNEKDWKISGLAWPSYWVRWINAGGCSPWYASGTMWFLKHVAILPALRKSIAAMERADQEGDIPKILCNEKARHDLQHRLEVYYQKNLNSPTLTQFGKVFNYIGALPCLQSHVGLLRLCMNPQVQKEEIQQPVIIVSFSRTGTTILHRTMALDRDTWRNFDVCDMLCPLPRPAPRWDHQQRQGKAAEAQKLIDSVQAIYPGWMQCLETMHGVRANEADEDMMWYNSAIGHPYMDPLMRLYPAMRQEPGGISSLESDEVAAYKYAWLQMMMKLHQYIDRKHPETSAQPDDDDSSDRTTTRPWLLKDPNHSAHLPQLLEAFPDARLIFTHRSPAEIVPSLAKLMAIFVSVDFVPDSPGSTSAELGMETTLRMQQYANGIANFTKSQPPDSPLAFQKASSAAKNKNNLHRLDFWFRDVVSDVPGTIDTVYASFLGSTPSQEAKEKFAQYLDTNERAKLGNQQRSLDDFSLTKEKMNEAFHEYNELFLSKYP